MENSTDSSSATEYNLRSPAVKRILREACEMKSATYEYYAQPLEDNLFEWHFTVRGPPDSNFSGGIYHGRIILPSDYPMKPPSIIMLTPNGRFEVKKKICLSISGYHPESWQPCWSIRTVLMAIIAFMPTKAEGSIGSIEYTTPERKKLAKMSQNWSCEHCGKIKRYLLDSPAPVDVEGKSTKAPMGKEDQEFFKNVLFKDTVEISGTSDEKPAPISKSKANTIKKLEELFDEYASQGVPMPLDAELNQTLNPNDFDRQHQELERLLEASLRLEEEDAHGRDTNTTEVVNNENESIGNSSFVLTPEDRFLLNIIFYITLLFIFLLLLRRSFFIMYPNIGFE